MADSRRGLTLVEVVVSLLVVAVMIGAGLGASSRAVTTRSAAGERARAQLLAGTLLSEVLAKHFRESAGALGPDAGESLTDRATLDDVDDFDGYTQSPPATLGGDPLAPAGWAWSAEIEWITPATLATSPIETGTKRVRVSVTRAGREVGTVVGFKSLSFEESR
ncbi:MAG: prepilin-type N-terminal cleavage/methylation domain-containing protein [Phycisphaerales bacterium]